MISISQCSRKSIELIYNTFWSQTFYSLLFYKVSKENLPSLCNVLKIYSFSYRCCQFIIMKCSHCRLIMWTLIKVHVVQVKHICFLVSVLFSWVNDVCCTFYFLFLLINLWSSSFCFLLCSYPVCSHNSDFNTEFCSMVSILYLASLSVITKVGKWNFTTNA